MNVVKEKLVSVVESCSLQHLVENVECAFFGRLTNNTRFFEEVRLNIGARDETRRVEVDANKFSKTRRVIVTNGLGITVCLQDRVGLDDLVLQGGLLLLSLLHLLAGAGADKGKVGDDLLGVLSLSGPGLASNQDGLILALWKKELSWRPSSSL